MSKLYKKPSFIGLTDKLVKPDFLNINPDDDPKPDPIGSTVESDPTDDDWDEEP